MWYKVKELYDKGLNKSQISLETGIHRKTVRKYLEMSETDFHKWMGRSCCLPRKLNEYFGYVLKLLEQHPYLSASQVEDRLKENFSTLPLVHSKTIYNFVQSIREKHGIMKKNGKQPRQFEKLPELDYGLQAQADFGQYHMQTQGGGIKKVYFFVMVLCRSRQKFIFFQTRPFTTAITITAHDKAFVYFKGKPKEIVYDQDRVLISDENLGDILLTQEFAVYVAQMEFKAVFCRKSDPQSKGKVENVVKYVKNNFLRGRAFLSEEELNQSALGWLERTANGKEHNGTKKIPLKEWEIEQKHLIPLKEHPVCHQQPLNKYKVRKDNTINYKSNFYTLPLGTYQGQETWVSLKEVQQEIRIYNIEGDLLTVHPMCYQRGTTVRNTDHTRDKSNSLSLLKEELMQKMPHKEKGLLYIDMLNKEKPRYLRDNLLVLKKDLTQAQPDIILQALDFCLENNVYNAYRFTEVARHYQQQADQKIKTPLISPQITGKPFSDHLNITPQTSKLSTYETIL